MPSRLGWRHCIAATSRNGIFSSKTSSQVTTRSREGIAAARQLSIVVLPAWVPPATRMFRPAATRRVEEPRRRPRQRAQPHEVVEVVGLDDELADVDAPVGPGDVGDDHVEPGAVGQGGVDERRRQVHPAPRRLQHPLDEVAHLVGGQERAWSARRCRRGRRTPSSGSLIQISSTVGSSRKGWIGPNPATASRTLLVAPSQVGAGPAGHRAATAPRSRRWRRAPAAGSSARPSAGRCRSVG